MSRRSTTYRKRKRRSLALSVVDLGAESSSIDTGESLRPPKSDTRRRKSRRTTAATKSDQDYIRQTLRPIVCLAFVFPMLFVYELGSIFTDQMSAKSGIDQWLHWFMDLFGAGHLVVLPVVTAGILLHWHHRIKDHWQINPRILLGMFAESLCLGAILFFAGNALYQFIVIDLPSSQIISTGDAIANTRTWSTTIAYIGSGVYEELFFRLILLNGLIQVGKFYLPKQQTLVISMVLTSLIFAAVHYHFCNPAGAVFDVQGFLFRFLASLVFCLLYLFRGFGVAVGTHVAYDVMTQI